MPNMDAPVIPSWPTPLRPGPTLGDEHALLLREVEQRCAAAIKQVTTDRWPTLAVRRLLDYLYVEVLEQVADEEWRLFRTWGHDPVQLTALRAEHLRIRRAIEALADAAVQADPPPAGELSDLVTVLISILRQHFAAEQVALRRDTEEAPPSTAALGSPPHEWYTRAEGPDIDLDDLPGPQGDHVVIARLMRLRQGERVELHGKTDPSAMLRLLGATHPGSYGFSYLKCEPHRWRVEVRRRGAS
jgi:uncharacterized protein (DUF2249 family)